MQEPEWVFCQCEKCSHGLVALRRSSELPSGRQQAEGAWVDLKVHVAV